MHPIMSDIDLSVRHFERELEQKAVQHRFLVKDVARQHGGLGLGTRMVHAVWQFIDPRGFALAQYRRSEQQAKVTPTIAEPLVVLAATPIRTLPVATTTIMDVPDWRKAA